MEQKKTLWIIAAVGAFLLVVLGTAGLFYYSPATKPVPTIATVSPVEKNNQDTGWLTTITEQQNTVQPNQINTLSNEQSSTVSELFILADNATTIDLNSLKNNDSSQTQLEAQGQNINITVNIPDNKESDFIDTPVVKPSNEFLQNETKIITVKKNEDLKKSDIKSSDSKTVTKTTKSVLKPTQNTTVTATVNKTEVHKTQFWVQVAAYSNKKGAENARSILDSNRIPADIFTYKDNKDKLFYRVRIGPYTTKSEAEYWRSRIIKIEDFSKAESYITTTTN